MFLLAMYTVPVSLPTVIFCLIAAVEIRRQYERALSEGQRTYHCALEARRLDAGPPGFTHPGH
jgi:hypothetical protein